jgi:26S proteasome regulatory subunit N10
MSLEATMILLDNSDFSLNGDYFPTRWDAQKDGVALLSSAKYNANPESMVGLALMGGR